MSRGLWSEEGKRAINAAHGVGMVGFDTISRTSGTLGVSSGLAALLRGLCPSPWACLQPEPEEHPPNRKELLH